MQYGLMLREPPPNATHVEGWHLIIAEVPTDHYFGTATSPEAQREISEYLGNEIAGEEWRSMSISSKDGDRLAIMGWCGGDVTVASNWYRCFTKDCAVEVYKSQPGIVVAVYCPVCGSSPHDPKS